jgi:small neutral amino acid transporter SnatA (MarC family)
VVRVVAVAALVGAGVFGVLAPPERCPTVTVDDLDVAATRTVDWFVHNQNGDGTWLYQYDAEGDRVIDDYNIVRHAGAIMGLYQATQSGYTDALDSADAGLEWLLDRTFDNDDGTWTAVSWQGETSVGTVALLTAGLVDRRLATGDEVHDDLLRRLGGFLAAQTEPSGAILAYYSRADDAPVPGLYSKYYTGEAYWALTRLHRTFPDEGWGDVSDRVGRYLATQRDDVEDNWPDIPDHWAAYGLSETVHFEDRSAADRGPLTGAEAAYASRQAGLFGSQVRWVSQRFGPWGLVVRAPHVPRGGGYGVVGEALTGYWRVAEAEPAMAHLQAPIAERARCIAGLAILNQSGPEDAAQYPGDPSRIVGAWFRDGETRMDDQQHALSALMRTRAIVESDDAAGGPRDGGDMPSTWLWVVALVAALDPFRTALAVPRSGVRSRREVAVLAAVGGLAGGALVLVVALLGGPLLDALDVSGPAMRLAAGIVGGVAGLLALFGQLPLPATGSAALPGRRAALVPVAVPLIATPALLVLSISAADDHNVGLVAGALALGVALLTLVAYSLPGSSTAGAAAVDPAAAASGETSGVVPVAEGGAVVDPAVVEPEAAAGMAAAAPPQQTTVGLAPEVAAQDEVERSTAGVVARWAGRVTAVALLVSSVALAIDGVFAV